MSSPRILRGGRVFFSERKRQSKRKMAGIVCPPPFPLLPVSLFFLKTRLFRCFLPFFFFLKRKGKRRELIFFCFSFSAFKEREKEKRKKSKTSPLFPLLLQAFFFSQKKTYGRKFGMLRGEGKDWKEKKKKEMRDMIATRKAGLVLFLTVPLRAVGKLIWK